MRIKGFGWFSARNEFRNQFWKNPNNSKVLGFEGIFEMSFQKPSKPF